MYNQRTIKIGAAALLALLCIFFVGYLYPVATGYADAEWYIKIAQGRISAAIQPFAARVLHPIVVRLFSDLSGFNLDVSFYIINIFLLACFIVVISLFFQELSLVNPLLTFVLIFTPFLLEFHRHFYLSEVPYALLAALFLFCLKKGKTVLSLLALFLLFLARPTDAMVLGIVFVAISFYKKEIKQAKIGLVVAFVAYLISSFVIVPMSAPNIHNINNFIYRALEPPYYFVKSFLGIDWFVNTQVAFCTPTSILHLPGFLQIGNIKWIDICGFNILNPLSVIFYALVTFGIIPGILLMLLLRIIARGNWSLFFAGNETWLLTALGYGIFYLVMGSLVPNLRTVSYAWPAMWLAGLFMFDSYLRQFSQVVKTRTTQVFLLGQAAVSWIPYLIINNTLRPEILTFTLLIAFVLIIYFISLRRMFFLAKSQA